MATSTLLSRERDNVLHLNLRRSAFDHIMYCLLYRLPQIRTIVGEIRPVWLLPPTIVLKRLKEGWVDEFIHEKEVYHNHVAIQDRVIAIYYGEAWYDGTPAILLSYIPGSTLNERHDIKPEDLEAKLLDGLKLMAEDGLVHNNPTLANILFDGKQVWFVDFEQTDDIAEFNAKAQASTIRKKFANRQANIDK
jgi:hypothetical protein